MTSPGTAPVGKGYDGGRWTVGADEILAYAEATDDPNPRYRGPGAVAPPMFHVRPLIGLMLDMARDPALGIDLLRLVHGEHAMRFLAPIRPGQELALSGELLAVEPKSSGTVYRFALRASAAEGPVLDGHTVYFVRAPEGAGERGSSRRVPPEPPPPDWTATQPVAPDQALRYAAASGDGNPIHTDPEVARKAGLPRPILHGLCTLAFAARDLVDRAAEGDPARLASLAARWARPVFPGDELTLQVWGPREGSLDFRTLGPQGQPVLVHGRAELREA